MISTLAKRLVKQLKESNFATYVNCFHQTYIVKKNLFRDKLFVPDVSAEQLLRDRIAKGQSGQWQQGKPYKTFLVCSVNNWEQELVDAFEDHGTTYHFGWENVREFFPDKSQWVLYFNQLNERLKDEFDRFYSPVDNIVVFFYAADFSIAAETIRYLRRPNVLQISFCWDDLLYFKRQVRNQPVGISRMCKEVDFNLTLSPEALPQYTKRGTPCFFWNSLPLANTTLSDASNLLPEVRDEFYVLFIGSKYGWRPALIDYIRKAGFEVRCYGKGWGSSSVSNTEMKQMIAKAPVTLGFSNVGATRTITVIKGRDFEVPLWGGVYLTQHSKGLEAYYKIGTEVLCYRTAKDCIVQLNMLRANTELRELIRRKGQAAAVQIAPWRSRLAYMDQLISAYVRYT